MKQQSARYIALGQAILGLCLLICLAIIPHYFFSHNQGGISNYGTDGRTRGLFVTGFAAATLGAVMAGTTLPAHIARLRAALFGLGILYLAVMLSTFSYKISPAYDRLHERAAIALFIGMLAIALWLRSALGQDKQIRFAFVLFCVGFFLAALTTLGYLHLLFTGQVLSAASFAYLLTRGVSLLKTPKNLM